MARETAEERTIRRATEIARHEEHARQMAEKFKAELPERLRAIVDLARELCISCEISLIKSGPSVRIRNDSNRNSFDDILTYESEEWEVSHIETSLKDLKHTIEESKVRFKLARDVFAKLSDDERAAIKEFLHLIH